jgi:hypothetical protein
MTTFETSLAKRLSLAPQSDARRPAPGAAGCCHASAGRIKFISKSDMKRPKDL